MEGIRSLDGSEADFEVEDDGTKAWQGCYHGGDLEPWRLRVWLVKDDEA